MVIKIKTMKKLLFIISAAMLLVSCGNKNDDKGKLTLEDQLSGEWHSVSLTVDGDIYLKFESLDKTFELYQQIGAGAHRLYRGTWNLEGQILTGRYNDGEDWSTAYTIVISGNTLTMTSNNDAAEESIFETCEIPAEIKETCETVVRSAPCLAY